MNSLTSSRTLPREARIMKPKPDWNRADIETDDRGLVRLQKFLAQSGVASRRRCEELMLAGSVTVDGEVVTRLGTKVDPATAIVRVDGKRLAPISAQVYLVLEQAPWCCLHHVGS